MATYTKSLSGDFAGINIKQLQSEISENVGIGPTITGVVLDDDDVDISFDSSLNAGEQTVLDVIIAAHVPDPPVLSTFTFKTITASDSPCTLKRDSLLCDTAGGDITVRLKKASRSEDVYLVVKKTAASNTVTIDPHGSELIDGQSTKILTALNEVVAIQCDGTSWAIMNGTESISRNDQLIDITVTDEKGDIIVDNGDMQAILSVGADGEILIADSATNLGLKYGTLSDVSGYVAAEHVDWTADAGASNIHDANIVASSVTQHEASITHDNLTGAGTNTHAQIDSHISATAAHGATGAVVGTTNTQTLTNKTINTASNTLTVAAADITSGTFADARVAESNVTQHVASIDHNALLNYSISEHRTINDSGSAATDLWSADKISTELSSHTHAINDASDITITTPADNEVLAYNGAGQWINQTAAEAGLASASHSHTTTDVTSGTFADARIAASNVTQHEASINHDALSGFVANEHIDHSAVSITAGEGLTGGGTIAANRTLDLDINSLTADASPDGAADYVVTYDASATSHKKVLINNLPGGGSSTLVGLSDTTISSPTNGQVLKYNGSIWINDTDVGNTSNLPLVQVRQASGYALTTVFANMTFATTDIETDSSIVEHNNTNTDRIDIKQTGYYRISFSCAHNSTAIWNQIDGKLLINDATLVVGSETWGPGYASGTSKISGSISHSIDVYLTNGDYITVQYKVVTACNTLYDATMSVLKLDGVTGPAGPTGANGDITWEGAWVSQNYLQNQAVSYNGASYVCKLNTVSNEIPTNATYWDTLAAKGDQGDQGVQGVQGNTGLVDWQGAWVSQNYTVDQSVEYNGSSYICILNTVSNEVPTNATYWDLLVAKGDTGTPGAGSSIIFKDNNIDIANTPHTALDFSGSGFTITDQGAGVARLTIDAVFGSEYQYAEDDTESSTTSATYIEKLKMTTTSLIGGEYRIGWTYNWNFSAPSSSGFRAQVQVDDTTTIDEYVTRSYSYSATLERRTVYGFKKMTLSAGVHTIDVDFDRNNGGTAYIRNVRIELYRVS